MVKEDEILVGNEEILGGLKAATSRGETLKEAMMTFYQAGYDKAEIEEAARAYLSQTQGQPNFNPAQRIQMPSAQVKPEEKKKEEKKGLFGKKSPILPAKMTPGLKPLTPPKTGAAVTAKQDKKPLQKVSNYEPPKRKAPTSGKGLTILLGIILFLLLGALAAVILFKAELVNFFNSLFG
jgi:hypothetical protein